jgi:hypothetical protein
VRRRLGEVSETPGGTHTGLVLSRVAAVAVKAAVAFVCAAGLVAMHQLPASAAPAHHVMAADAHAMASHATASASPTTGHACGHDAVRAITTEGCADHHACQALVPQKRTVAATPAAAVYVVAVAVPEHVVPVRSLGSTGGGGDPPDLNVLSVSRT